MRYPPLYYSVVPLLLSTALRLTAAELPQPALEPQPGVLVLNNGQTLEGKITRAGDGYYVVFENGAIQLPAAKVTLHCRDLQEAYQKQRDSLVGDAVQERIKLALWCLQNKLFDQASEQLDAAAQGRGDPKIAILRRRLELAQHSDPAPTSATASPAPSGLIGADELDRLIRSMPAGTVESFANTVQPLMLNHCATAACHGPQAQNGFALLRNTVGGAPSRRLTQRNLYHVLEHVDRDHPESSAILKAAGEPHGPNRTPILNGRETEKYRLLAAWVRSVANGGDRRAPSAVDAAAVLRRAREQSAGRRADAAADEIGGGEEGEWSQGEGDDEFRVLPDGSIVTRAPGDAQQPATQGERRASKPPIYGAAGMAGRQSNVRRGSVPQVTPRDPFDPELFNRQFHPPQ